MNSGNEFIWVTALLFPLQMSKLTNPVNIDIQLRKNAEKDVFYVRYVSI